MFSWLEQFNIRSNFTLLNAGDPALEYFTRRDLHGEAVSPIDRLWQLPEASRILRNSSRTAAGRVPVSRNTRQLNTA